MFDIVNGHEILFLVIIFITCIILNVNGDLFNMRKESIFAYITNVILNTIIGIIVALFILDKMYYGIK